MRCPACTEVLAENATRCDCGWKRQKLSDSDQARARRSELATDVRSSYEINAPKVEDLSDQQWYNVCRFFPSIVEHCKRERPEISADHPLHATSRMSIFARLRAVMPEPIREPGEEG